jgi:hypothetical protein
VNHEILLVKLKRQGFGDVALKWIKSYLTGRLQQTCVNSAVSDTLVMQCGVPQGSILGPILFILYTADMHRCLQHCELSAYADDAVLMIDCAPGDVDAKKRDMAIDFGNISCWAAANLMKLNPEKTKYILFSSHYYSSALAKSYIRLEGEDIVATDSLKLLGVVFDRHLTFRKHIGHVSRSVTGFLRTLSANRRRLPRKVKAMLVNAYVVSRLSYCLPVFGHRIEVIDAFQKLQNFGIRVIYGLPKSSSVQLLREHLGWLDIRRLYKYRLALMVHKAIHGCAPKYLDLSLAERQPTHRYRLRRVHFRQDVGHDNQFLENSFFEKATEMYNEIGGAVFAESMSRFKAVILHNMQH